MVGVAPAAVVPARSRAAVVKPATGSLNVTANATAEPPAGLPCPVARPTVTDGAWLSKVTVLFAPVEAAVAFPARSLTAPAATDAATVPVWLPEMATATRYEYGSTPGVTDWTVANAAS